MKTDNEITEVIQSIDAILYGDNPPENMHDEDYMKVVQDVLEWVTGDQDHPLKDCPGYDGG